MEGEAVRRRVNMIAAHFASKDDISPTHLLPMNCSGSLNSMLRRCDNKIYFARQASASLGPFMRQASLEEGSLTSPVHSASKDDIPLTNLQHMNSCVLRRCDNKIYFARQASASLGPFMRQCSLEECSLTSPVAPKSCGSASKAPCNVREPCFARPARTKSNFQNSLTSPVAPKYCAAAFETPCNVREPCFARPTGIESNFSNISLGQPLVQSYDVLAPNPPSFARLGRLTAKEDQLPSEKKMCRSEVSVEWSPRMDVAESEGKYFMTVEVPGVSIKDIRVEVDDQKLSVKGKRSTSFWRDAGNSNGSFSSYHRREILYGPYEVVWPLPAGANKDRVSAEFLDGFLQIVIPKV